ncbi:MAG TPA: PsiF family protein [Burkholderiales bacterium]|jgi:mannitol-specific phosphotransferase system IIBC component
MRKLIAVLGSVLLVASSAVLAADKAQKESIEKQRAEQQQQQQQRAKSCGVKAEDRKGEEREKFIRACLKGG